MKKIDRKELLFTLAIIGLAEITIGAIFKNELKSSGWLIYWNILGLIFFVFFLIVLLTGKKK